MILRMIIITIIINSSLIMMIIGIIMIAIIIRIILIVMKIRIAIITITIRLSFIVMIMTTIIITIIPIVMIIGTILKTRILLLLIIKKLTVTIIIIQGQTNSKNVATKIGRCFLNLMDKHFPRDHKFHKIFNRINIKFSYSCMSSIKSTINSHNRKILHPPVKNQIRTCNCINKTDYPLQENTLYQTDISPENFQTKNVENFLMWKILRQYHPYNINTKRYRPCLNETLQIGIYRGNNMLNKRTEIISKCRHRNKDALASYDSID